MADLRRAVAREGALAADVRFGDGTTSPERLLAASDELRAIRARLRELRA